MMQSGTFFTIGYGGRKPAEFVSLLLHKGIRMVVDVRLKPNRTSMGVYVKAKTPDKGIERLLGQAGIHYLSLPKLGNPFLTDDNWREPYERYLEEKGDELLKSLDEVEQPFCLMCAEKKVKECHRQMIAALLVANGWHAAHIE